MGGVDDHNIKEAEAANENIDGGRTYRGGQSDAADAMDEVYLELQGYGIEEKLLYQDNMSEILLEKNGKKSSTKNTKHINVRYCFIKDQVKSGEVIIENFPTTDMLGGIFTKPLQGALFRKFRA